MIALDSVEVQLGTALAVRGLTLSAPEGSWLALVGPNGAGKSTVLRCLANLVRFRGAIMVAGRELTTMHRRDLARSVAYVPQEPVFPVDMTAAEYVLLGRTAHSRPFGAFSARDRTVTADLLQRLDLETFADRRVGAMSGGERQRMVLARALAQEAPVLLMDEPTSALDLGHRIAVLELVDELRRERGLTVVTAIHDLTLAGQFADALALIDGGRLLAHDRPGEVLREDVLGLAFGAPVRVVHHEGDLVVLSQRPQLRERSLLL